MNIQFNGTKYKILENEVNETGTSLKVKISKLIGKPTKAIRMICNGYTLLDESIVPSNSKVFVILQMY